MEENLKDLIQYLKLLSEEQHNQGVRLRDVSESLSEWNYGYSEGLDYAIDKLEALIK